MNPIDWNTTAAWIALIISITTPAISLLLNNIHQRKLKRLELRHQKEIEYYHQQCNIFSNYLKQVSIHIHALGGSIFDYSTAYHELFMYVPQRYWDLLASFDDAIRSNNAEKIDLLYLEVTQTLASLLQEQQKQIPV